MAGKLTIKGRRERDTLCRICQYSLVMTNPSGDVKVHCRQIDRRIHGPVTDCSEFEERFTTPLWKMEKIAAIMDPKRRFAGFHKPGTEEHRRLRKEDDD